MHSGLLLFSAYLKCMNISRLLNFFLLKLSFFFSKFAGKPLFWGNAFAVSIETVAGCNLNCPGCEQGTGQTGRDNEIMDFEKFAFAVDKLPSTVFHINLHFQGEPLLNPEIAKMVNYARQKKMFVSFSTNANKLENITAKNLIKAGLSHIIFSLDGFDNESYASYRRGGNFPLLVNNIKNFSLQKKSIHSRFPVTEIQTIVTSHNEKNLNKIKKLAKELNADIFSRKSAYVIDLKTLPNYLPRNEKYRRYTVMPDGSLINKRKIRRFCFRLHSQRVILIDLNVVACCFDKKGEIILGNLNTQNFNEIHKGIVAKQLAKNLANRKTPDFCKNCVL